MIYNLKPYPDMQNSGVPWLGKVPAHWEIKKLRSILKPISARNRSDLPLMSVVRERGVIPRDVASKEENHNFVPDDLSNYKIVKVGQFAMNKMKAWQGSYGVSRHTGIVSPAYFVFNVAGICGGFFHNAIRSRAYVPFFAQSSDGVRIGQWDLSQSRMKEIPFAIPSEQEQAAIVRFLNHATARIGKTIRAKQKLVKLLDEQKQAIIHRAVTRGLDPNVRLKPSGIEWLGDVPEHWEVVPIKRAFKSMTYGISESATDDGVIPMLTMGHIRAGEISVPRTGGVSKIDPTLLLEEGDLLFNRTNSAELVGKVGLFLGALRPVTFASYLVRLRRLPSTNPDFMNMLLNDCSLLSAARREAIPSLHQSNLNPTRYGRLHVALPSLEEQTTIVRCTTERARPLQQTIDNVSCEITLLREYRTRLIADVVTGKLDVREAAARLPDEAPGVEAASGAEAWAKEESTESDDMDEVAVEDAEA